MRDSAPYAAKLEDSEYVAEMSLDAQRQAETDFRGIEAMLEAELPSMSFEQAASRLVASADSFIDGGNIFRFKKPLTSERMSGEYTFLPNPTQGQMNLYSRMLTKLEGTKTQGGETFTGKFSDPERGQGSIPESGRWSKEDGRSLTGKFDWVDGLSGKVFLGRITFPDGTHFDGISWSEFEMITGLLKEDEKVLAAYSKGEKTIVAQGQQTAAPKQGDPTLSGAVSDVLKKE